MSRKLLLTAVSMVLFFAASPQAATQEEVLGVKTRQQGLKVFDEKCILCHNRQRIEEAVKERGDMAKIIRRMEKKGAVLTEKERQVIGHFWRQNPLKTKGVTGEPKK